ncbi:MAG TPA: hypothetical protein VHB68_04720 [Steroidobacteraceae bacterium]|nr:hypothetical protein [Steroidobacteraceae bacterium]
MSTHWNLIELSDLGVLRFRGPDAVSFLQGQVSNDVARLTPERALLAGYHNPQGRTIALLRLIQLEAGDLLAVLPRELAANVAARLARFVLRAKVKITDDSAAWRLTGLVAPETGSPTRPPDRSGAADGGGLEKTETQARNWAQTQFDEASARATAAGEQSSVAAQLEGDSVVELPAASALMLPADVNAQSRSDDTVIIRVGMTRARWLVLSPAGHPIPLADCVPAERDAWRLLDIADGQPQVYASTSEEFVAQMLNLDALGGIAFDKGCYTGQEVIARAHYRGRVKRRLQRFRTRGPAKLAAGDSGKLTDGRSFKVVDAIILANGLCEFLAVAPLTPDTAETVSGETIDSEAMPLPYELPA